MRCDYKLCPSADEDTTYYDWGSYHELCWELQGEDEARYWGQVYYGSRTLNDDDRTLNEDKSLAYELGDPKRFDLEEVEL